MTEEQIKEMLNGIINNGEKWECRHSVQVNKSIAFPEYEWSNWQPYKLGDEIHSNWEYRKVKKTWLEEGISILAISEDDIKVVSSLVCKKILEEVSKNLIKKECEGTFDYYIAESDIKEIIKDLGVEV